MKQILIPIFSITATLLLLMACQTSTDSDNVMSDSDPAFENKQRAYFASGCFWWLRSHYGGLSRSHKGKI